MKAPGAVAGVPVTAAVAAGVVIVTWASAYAAIRAALSAFSPAHLALFRYSVASAVFAVYAVAARMPLPDRRDMPGLALTGMLGIAFYNLALGYGETMVPAATASLIIASAPAWMALLGCALFHERLLAWGWAGMALSLAGVALISLGSGSGLRVEPAALVLLAAALASSLYSLGQKTYLSRYTALQCTTYAVWSGTLFLVPFARGLLESIRTAPAASTAAVVYLGLFPGALGYIAWASTLARLPATTAASILYLVPPMALVIGWVWLGEAPSALAVLGGTLVLAGVAVVNVKGRAGLRGAAAATASIRGRSG